MFLESLHMYTTAMSAFYIVDNLSVKI